MRLDNIDQKKEEEIIAVHVADMYVSLSPN